MNSIDQSICLPDGSEDHEQPQNCIFRAITDYEAIIDSEEELQGPTQQIENNYQGFQNKRSLKIKPVNMFQDLISLQKENAEKKKMVKQLQDLNGRLRDEYEECVSHNDKLEHFFKEVQFTFQPEKKKILNSEVMVRAKKNLYQEAREARQRMKKMYKSNEASAIQELKMYIGVLETQRQKLVLQTELLQKEVAERLQIQDFNSLQVNKFNAGCQRIKRTINRDLEMVKSRYEEYKQEKMIIKSKVKARHLETEKKKYKEECDIMKGLLMEFEGLEYEIELLKHRIKQRKKQSFDYEDLRERISHKEAATMRLEKELREKFKTYQYMMEWTKQLKKQLEARKSEHAKKKAAFQDQINTLTTDYEKYSQHYKAGLFEEQAAKRKGSRQMVTSNLTVKPAQVKLVTFDEIRISLRSLSFFLLDSDQQVDQFIDDLLRVRPSRPDICFKENRKLKLKATLSLQKYQNFHPDSVTIQDICDSFDFSKSHNLTKEEYTKLAHFMVEDSKGIQDLKQTIEIKIARQILKNLLARQIDSLDELSQAQDGVGKVLRLHGDVMRPELKLSGGVEEEIEVAVLKQVMRKYGLDPYHRNIYTEFMEFWGWRKRRSIGFIKLSDYDEMVLLLSKHRQEVSQQFSDSDI